MFEACLLDINAIRPGKHVHELVQPLTPRGLGALFLRTDIGQSHLRAGNGGA